MTPTTAFLLAVIAITVGTENLRAQQAARTWTDRNGNQIEAAFESYDAGRRQVSLRLANDSRLQIGLDQLSHADRRYILRVARKTRADGVSRDQPEPRKTAGKRSARRSADSRRRFGIDWTVGMEKALASASGEAGTGDDRPVMWMRVLGDLNGFM